MSEKTTDKSTVKKGFSTLKVAHKATCIALVTAAVLIAICLVTDGMGTLGGGIRSLLRGLFSYGAILLPIALVAQAVGFAEDLEDKRFGKRSIFALISMSLISCIEYAIFTWNTEPVFSPAESFFNMNGGGFVGGIIGFVLSSLIGQLGVVIVCVAALAIYATFFFAEKAGSIGQAALNFAKGVKSAILFIKNKHQAYTEKKKRIKEDAEQHQREVSSEELSDDEFFRAKGDASDVKIKKLGIEENSSTHGLSALADPENRVHEEPSPVEEPKPKRKADKPLDLSYGIEEEVPAEAEPPKEAEKPKVDKSAIGIDDSADNVFTRDFEPFNFATSEKEAAKYASRVANGSAVTEELDEMTIYQMKADHEPDEREKRLMELERRKQEWMRHKGGSSAAATPSSSEFAGRESKPVETISSASSESTVVHTTTPDTKPTSTTASETVKPVSHSSSSTAPIASRTPAEARPQSIKTVEFTVSKTPKSDPIPPREARPTTVKVEKPAVKEETVEDAAILIAERVARDNPTYARSANDLKTYTTVVADEDDELYRQLEGISDPTPSVNAEAESDIPAEERVNTTDYSSAPTSTVITEITEPKVQSETVENTVCSEPVLDAANETTNTTEIQSEKPHIPTTAVEYEEEKMEEDTSNNPPVKSEEEPTPQFMPYAPSLEVVTTPAVEVDKEDNKLKVERSMLPPTPESIYPPASEETSVPSVQNESTVVAENDEKPKVSENTEIDFTPVEDELPAEKMTSQASHVDSSVAEPLFEEIDTHEDEYEDDNESADIDDTVSFDEEDDEDIDNEGFEEDADEIPVDEIAEDIEGEIPPEEQNPEVIRMRGMFNVLDPVDNNSDKATSIPEQTSRAEITVTDESTEDEPPFDDAVVVKPSVQEAIPEAVPQSKPSAAIVPVNEKKTQKKEKTDYSDYQFPPLEILAAEKDGQDENIQTEIQENADKLIETLASFGVTASIKGVDRGPRITRYEVVPAKGVKVSSILNLQDDIALNLAAGSIRMEAPIPGKSAVGIEIPNKKSSIVRLRNLIETPDFESAKSKTFVCIGRDVAGQPVFGDLAKMPHLLIAGATGMGKSVCINSLLISILYKAKPDEVKFIMIDPKQVEFTMYNGIPHLLVPVVSDAKQAAGALMWAVEEMERRYNLLNSVCSKSVDSYNEKVAQDPSLGEFLPKIIIVIDEFADLMLQVKDPVENLVTRIAQKARAAGIHLVIGTQRPSVNVITGVIKANVPSRISCKVMSIVDSKTVLDSAGADKLLDKGDALYAPAGSPKPHRLQCAFVDEGEAEAIMNYLKARNDGASYDSTVMEDIERAAQKCSKKGGSDRDDGDRDEGNGEGYLNDRQFLDAVEIAVNTRKISTSLIQRKLSIGYGKAAKFIDVMEDMGIVGPANGQRPREVLLTPDEWREKLSRLYID